MSEPIKTHRDGEIHYRSTPFGLLESRESSTLPRCWFLDGEPITAERAAEIEAACPPPLTIAYKQGDLVWKP